ncbi:MAG: DUF3226 domain-containing protein [Methylococcaceae bacterium]
MRKYSYLVVEGAHDVEFVYRLLSPFNMARVKNESELDSFFKPLIPRQYPPQGDLQKRMPIPLFLQNETHAIAIHSAVGDSQLVNVLVDNADILNLDTIIGVGILLDSDSEVSAEKRYDNIKMELLTKSKQQFQLPNKAGDVLGKPKLGAFVLPDNHTVGTLENLLLESAELVYPELLNFAKNYVNAAKTITFNKNDSKDFEKPAGQNKAIIGAMTNIMRPSKSVQVSIQDNNWLKGDALSIDRIKAVQQFLKTLFDLE